MDFSLLITRAVKGMNIFGDIDLITACFFLILIVLNDKKSLKRIIFVC